MPEEGLEALLSFFKALADESRLRIVGVLANRERSVEEIAAELDLQGPTVSHHLAKLKSAGLVSMKRDGNVHYYRLDFAALHAMSKQVLDAGRPADVGDESGDAYERKVMRAFVSDGKIKELPASPKKRRVILTWLVDKIESGRRYPEKELNMLLEEYHPDYCTLRRYMIEEHLMEREAGIYWRT